MSRIQNLDVDHALRLIVEGTAAETGADFYAALVKGLATALNTTGAWVTEYLEQKDRLRALAFWLNGEFVSDYEYDLEGTPCDVVIKESRLVHVPDNVGQLFPDDPDLRAFNAVSYMGFPLLAADGRVLGHLAVLDTEPMPPDPRLESFLRIFATRAAAEHQRMRAEKEIRDRQEKLDRLVASAMDAILELDRDFRITLVNKAASATFNAAQELLLGQNFKDFLTPECRPVFAGVIDRLNTTQQHAWIPTGFIAVRMDGLIFPVEATLSLSSSHKPEFYTVILRNVNERDEAVRRIQQLNEQTEYLKEELRAAQNFDEIIGSSPVMVGLLSDVERVASTDASVLILGETGTGKELIARAIHNASKRAGKPLIKVNCAALPATLIESELFGHERGSFTGATAKRIGRFELADAGTIFLDEVGELPLELQAKLLRVLQEGEFEPLGSSKTVKVDVRVLAATNRDLSKLITEGKFREDLYYRLSVFPITVPPLRSRKEDIALLANNFLKRALQKFGGAVEPFSAEAIARLNAYEWPGNVRELQNVVERSVIVAENGRPNLDRALPPMERVSQPGSSFAEALAKGSNRVLTVLELQEMETKNILVALEISNWRIGGENGAAKLLGMKPSTLNSRIASLGLKRPSSESA